ncbi:MAG: FAD-dependent oxidoreductase [Trueperaceae bacterium]|nr:FAD-dependent oxidoreductase [Trueperaceae bacterium]
MPEHDIIIIGAGPGGYVAAIRAAQLGFNVASIDKNDGLGGTCLRVGCIPSKALLESSERYLEAKHSLADHGIEISGEVGLDLKKLLARKDQVVKSNVDGIDYLYKKNKITRYKGTGRFKDKNTVVVEAEDGDTELTAKRIIIATGSKVVSLPGVELDGDRIGTSTEAIDYSEVPEHLVVIGAGYIGIELGSVWHRLGAKVTIVEYLDRIMPGMDAEIAKEGLKIFKKQGLEFRLGSKVTGAKADGETCTVEIEARSRSSATGSSSRWGASRTPTGSASTPSA